MKDHLKAFILRELEYIKRHVRSEDETTRQFLQGERAAYIHMLYKIQELEDGVDLDGMVS